MGKLKSWIYKENFTPLSLPIAVLVKFDNNNVPTLYNIDLVQIMSSKFGILH